MYVNDALSAMRCIDHELREDKDLDRNSRDLFQIPFQLQYLALNGFILFLYVSTSHGSGSAVETQQIMSRTTKTTILLIQKLVLLLLQLLTTRSHLHSVDWQDKY
jgi:hypothetical protein